MHTIGIYFHPSLRQYFPCTEEWNAPEHFLPICISHMNEVLDSPPIPDQRLRIHPEQAQMCFKAALGSWICVWELHTVPWAAFQNSLEWDQSPSTHLKLDMYQQRTYTPVKEKSSAYLSCSQSSFSPKVSERRPANILTARLEKATKSLRGSAIPAIELCPLHVEVLESFEMDQGALKNQMRPAFYHLGRFSIRRSHPLPCLRTC